MFDLSTYTSLTTMMVLATKDSAGNPYTANVYFKTDQNHNFYFRSKFYREHSKHIIENCQIARSIINTQKYHKSDKDKKGLQFQGIGQLLEGTDFENTSLKIYGINKKYGDLIDSDSRIFKCTPNRVKIRDEEQYGGDGKVFLFE